MDNSDFDTIINRLGTNCSKWDNIPYDTHYDDMIAMWVADMDFPCPKEVLQPIIERLNHPIFGYFQFPKEYNESIINWHKNRYKVTIKDEFIVPIASVLGGLAMAIQSLTEKKNAIMVHTPGYLAFYNAAFYNERNLIHSPLIKNNDKFEINFEEMEQRIIANDVKLLMLCSPHNPTGRIWSKDELSKIIDICHKHSVYIISDEIHSDMTFTNSFHTTLSSNPKASEIVIALYSPTKTFNIAGLCTAYAVIPNQSLREKFNKTVLASGLKVKNTLGINALIGGYENGAKWVDSLQSYLLENAKYAVEFINTKIKNVHAYVPQATYFLWVDFSKTSLTSDEIIDGCVNGAHVAVYRGTNFIEGGDSYVRINYACPRAILEKALTQLEKEFNKEKYTLI